LSSLHLRTIWRYDVGIDLIHDEEKKFFKVTHIRDDNDDTYRKSCSTQDDCPRSHPQDDVDTVASSSSDFCWPVATINEMLNVPNSLTVLESIDGYNCEHRFNTVDDVWQFLDKSLREKTRTTITFATRTSYLASDVTLTKDDKDTIVSCSSSINSHDNDIRMGDQASGKDSGQPLHQPAEEGECDYQHVLIEDEYVASVAQNFSQNTFSATGRPNSKQRPKNSVHQAILIVFNPKQEHNDEAFGGDYNGFDDKVSKIQNENDEKDDDYGPLNETGYVELPSRFTSTLILPIVECGLKDKSSKKNSSRKGNILVLDKIPRQKHWLSDSCVQAGDVVLSINGVPTYSDFNVDDASLVFHTMVMTHAYVRIKTYGPTIRSRSRMDSFRRAAVGVAGGALVGVGGVLMATPLHPIGHAMALGGVGVLGMEFERPRKAIQHMKQSLNSSFRSIGYSPEKIVASKTCESDSITSLTRTTSSLSTEERVAT
jgi:hypothetical protein